MKVLVTQKILDGHSAAIVVVKVSPTGEFFIMGSDDYTAIKLDVETDAKQYPRMANSL